MARTGSWRGFKVCYRRRSGEWAGVLRDTFITLVAPSYAQLQRQIDAYWRYVPAGEQ